MTQISRGPEYQELDIKISGDFPALPWLPPLATPILPSFDVKEA